MVTAEAEDQLHVVVERERISDEAISRGRSTHARTEPIVLSGYRVDLNIVR